MTVDRSMAAAASEPWSIAAAEPVVRLDLVLAVAKSVSAYYAALLRPESLDAAAAVLDAHRDGVAAAVDYLHREAACALPAGRTSATRHLAAALDGEPAALPERRTELEYEARTVARATRRSQRAWLLVARLDVTELEHICAQDAPGQPPHLHTHLLIGPTVLTADDGRPWLLDEAALLDKLPPAAVVYDLAYEESLMARRPVRLERRPGSARRELAGVKPAVVLALRGSRCRPHRSVRQVVVTSDPDA